MRSRPQGCCDHWEILHNHICIHTAGQREREKLLFFHVTRAMSHLGRFPRWLAPSASGRGSHNVNKAEKVIFALLLLTCVHTRAARLQGASRHNTYGHQPETTLGILERKLLTVRMDTPPAFSSCIRVTMSSICGGEEGERVNGGTRKGRQIKSHSKTH